MPLLLLLIHFFVAQVFAIGAVLTPWEYEVIKPTLFGEVQSVAREVVSRCPPPECVVVGIGRSPAVVTTYLSELNPQSVVDLPLSRFRHNPNADVTGPRKLPQDLAPLAPEQEQRLFAHFERTLGDMLKQRPQKIMFLDYAVEGYSLFAVETYFSKFAKQKNLKIQTDTLALTKNKSLMLISMSC